MWILKENNEKATAGKKCFSKDNSIEKTLFSVMVSYNAKFFFFHCYCWYYLFFTFLTVFGKSLIKLVFLEEFNLNFYFPLKQTKSFFSDSASWKSSVQFHLIYLYHESQNQLEAIYGI